MPDLLLPENGFFSDDESNAPFRLYETKTATLNPPVQPVQVPGLDTRAPRDAAPTLNEQAFQEAEQFQKDQSINALIGTSSRFGNPGEQLKADQIRKLQSAIMGNESLGVSRDQALELLVIDAERKDRDVAARAQDDARRGKAASEALGYADAGTFQQPEARPEAAIQTEDQPIMLGTEQARSVAEEFPLTFKEPKYIDEDEAEAIQARYMTRLAFQDPKAYNELSERIYMDDNYGDGNYPVVNEDSLMASGAARTGIKFLQDPYSQAEALNKKFGLETRVAVDRTGKPNVMVLETKAGDTDQKVWRFLDAPKTTFADYGDFPSEVAPIAANVAGNIAGVYGGGGFMGGAALGAGAEFAVGSGQDAIARGVLGVDLDPAEIAKRRGLQSGISLGIDAGLGGFASKIGSFGDLGKLSIKGGVPAFRNSRIRFLSPKEGDPLVVQGQELLNSLELIQKETGVDLSRNMNLSTLTQDPTLIDMALLTARQPFLGRKLAREQRKLEEALAVVKDKVAPGTQMHDTNLGRTLIESVEGDVLNRRKEIKTFLESGQEVVDQTVKSQLGTAGLPLSQMEPNQVGYLLEQTYQDAFSRVNKTRNELYAEAAKLEPKGGVVTVEEVNKALTAETFNSLPAAIKNQLKEVAEEGAEPIMLPLNKLVEIRSRVRDKISSGFISPGEGLNVRDLTKVSENLTKLIDDISENVGTEEFKKAAQKANEFYKNDYLPFKAPDIARVLQPRDIAKSVGNDGMALLEQFTMGGGGRAVEQYNQLLRVLDEQGQAGSKQLLRQGILQAAKSEGGADYVGRTINRNIIDGDRFLKRMEKMEPEIFGDIFNEASNREARNQMTEAAKVLREMQGSGFGGKDFNFEDFLSRVDHGASFSDAIRQAAVKQKELDSIYKFQQQLASKGGMQRATFDPKEFTETLVNNAQTKEDVQLVTNILSNADPKLAEQVRDVYMRGLFDEAIDPISGKMTYENLERILLDKNQMIEGLIGKEGVQLAAAYAYVVQKSSKMSGSDMATSLSRMAATGKLLEIHSPSAKGIFNELTGFFPTFRKHTGSFAFSVLTRSNLLKEAMKRGYNKSISAAELSMVLGSKDALQALYQSFPEDSPEYQDYIQGLVDLNRKARKDEIEAAERKVGFVTEGQLSTPDADNMGLHPLRQGSPPMPGGFFTADDLQPAQ